MINKNKIFVKVAHPKGNGIHFISLDGDIFGLFYKSKIHHLSKYVPYKILPKVTICGMIPTRAIFVGYYKTTYSGKQVITWESSRTCEKCFDKVVVVNDLVFGLMKFFLTVKKGIAGLWKSKTQN